MAREKFEFLNEIFLKKGDMIICAFGEIDCRLHVFKHVDSINSYIDVVDEIVNNYCQFLLRLESLGYRITVWGPVGTRKDTNEFREEFPYSGTEEERNRATEYFNKCLSIICKMKGWGFMTAFYDMVSSDYRTNETFLYDGCHLSQEYRYILDRELDSIYEN